MFTARLLKPGDTFSGTASYDKCFDVEDHPTSLVIAAAEGNVFTGSIIAKLGTQIRSRPVKGFFYVPNRQMIVVPDEYGPGSISMVCSHKAGEENDADCQILSDSMTERCGSVVLNRDRTSEWLIPACSKFAHDIAAWNLLCDNVC